MGAPGALQPRPETARILSTLTQRDLRLLSKHSISQVQPESPVSGAIRTKYSQVEFFSVWTQLKLYSQLQQRTLRNAGGEIETLREARYDALVNKHRTCIGAVLDR